jgi:valyl-tRNA synthetase
VITPHDAFPVMLICDDERSVEFGVLYQFAFPLVGGDGEIVVTTTRPETVPGDRAVAVHPDDKRYKVCDYRSKLFLHYKLSLTTIVLEKHLHYKLVHHPLIPSVTLPIVPDAKLVDPEFGSGAVKITPAHDTNDYEFWKRHSSFAPASDAAHSPSEKRLNIPLVQVFDGSGKMLPACLVDSLIGHDRLHIRKLVVSLLKENGAYRGQVEHDVRVRICERSGSAIEPMLQPQWYLRTKPLAEKVIEVAKRDGLKFVPNDVSVQLWEQWLGGIQDWCLSRQIWWGHRIPAYKVINPKHAGGHHIERWVAAESDTKAYDCLTMEEKRRGCIVKQDEDVLDTWFSSGLLPLSTAGWRGGEGKDISGWEKNYPLTFIESGGDILFFWLARMAMLSTWFTEKLPFNEIILHPLLCDAIGRKMSKSVGNVLDPLLIIRGSPQASLIATAEAYFAPLLSRGDAGEKATKELKTRISEIRRQFPEGIQKSGTDVLRMTLLDYTRRPRYINMELRQVDVFRRLAVKLDHAFRFFNNARCEKFVPMPISKLHQLPFRTDQIAEEADYLAPHQLQQLNNLNALIRTVTDGFKTRQLYDATDAVRTHIYDHLCGFYIEFCKQDLANTNPSSSRRKVALSVLYHSFDILLRLLHPMMPFLTESLWQSLYGDDSPSILSTKWPEYCNQNPLHSPRDDEAVIETALDLITVLRKYVGAGGRDMVEEVRVALPDGAKGAYLNSIWETVLRLAKCNKVPVELVDRVKSGEVCRAEGEGYRNILWEYNGQWKLYEDPKRNKIFIFNP